MNESMRQQELIQALFNAVAAGDLKAAQDRLRMIVAAHGGQEADWAQEAFAKQHRPYAAPDMATSFVLPVPGHAPGMTLSGVAFGSARK